MHQLDRYRRDIGRLGRQRRYGFCDKPHSLAVRRAASARIRATLPQRQAARIVIRHPFNPAPHPQHHRWLALSNSLTHDQNPAAAVGTRIATSASVRAEERAVDREHRGE